MKFLIAPEWLFHPSYSKEHQAYLHSVLAERTAQLMTENYWRCVKMLEESNHYNVTTFGSAIKTDIHNICLLCFVLLRRGEAAPSQVLCAAGPIEFITEQGKDLMEQVEKFGQLEGAEMISFEKKAS